MLFKFFGAAQEVGRSSILMKDESTILFDYGVKLMEKPEYPVEVPRVDALFLSHAHLDHSGAVPVLYNNDFIPTFGTKPTSELSEILLEDSIKIAKKEHLQPHFHRRQVTSFLNRYVGVEYHKPFRFKNFDVTLLNAAHICGSATFVMERNGAKTNKRVIYTGDYKLDPMALHNGAEVPQGDVLITESTYALREHPNREELIKKFVGKIREIIDNKGTALLPAFALGRSQELLAILYQNGLIENTYLDGMSRKVTEVTLHNKEYISNYETLRAAVEKSTFIEDLEDRRDALKGPSIIVTTAGMLNGGPVMNYITKLGPNSEILLTGYQVRGSNGHRLLETGRINMDGHEVKIKSKATYFDFSAHAGKSELYEYVKRVSPSVVMCVHGDQDSSTAMAESLKMEGYEAYAPALDETIKIDG